MDTPAEKTKDWKDWLTQFKNSISADGWNDFMAVSLKDKISPWQWSAVYMLPVQSTLANAMLLACLQTPPAETETILHSIAEQAHGARFGKPPRGMARELREVYHESTRRIARILPSTADLLAAVFLHYIRDDYDTTTDSNLLIREAQALAASRNRNAALDAIGRAGAAALRGRHIWSGWADEGTDEFRHWALTLSAMLDGLAGVIPLGNIAEERPRANERAIGLLPEPKDEAEAELEDYEPEALKEQPSEEFVKEWLNVANREQPLTDDEIKEMGPRYKQFAELAFRAIEMSNARSEEVESHGEDLTGVAVTVLGMLRYSESPTLDMLIDLIVKQDELEDEDVVNDAVWALQQMGPAVLEQAFDFVRYSSLEKPRRDMLQVLAAAGRGREEVFSYLLQQFNDTAWANNKSIYALPLALTHDPRAVPIIVNALRDPAVTEADAWALLDALQELNVEFFINRDTRAVNIPDYGVIEDVLPLEWRSRIELDSERDAEQDDEAWDENDNEDWEDEDDEDEDVEDEYYDDVVYDKEGIPRCPDCGAEMHYIAGRWVHSPTHLDQK